LRSAYQNDLKTSKTYYFKAKKKKSNFFENTYKKHSQTGNFLSQVSRALKVLSFSYLLDIRFFHVNGGCNFASVSLYILLILGSLYNFIGFFFKSLYVFSNVGGLYFYKNIF
jgi:hypothetical protein